MGIICTARIYEYEGVKFEFHPVCGPAMIGKSGEPSLSSQSNKLFMDLFDRFHSEPDQEKFRISGGCIRVKE